MTQRFHGMVPDSTGMEWPADTNSIRLQSGLPTEASVVELSLSFPMAAGQLSYRLLIEAPTLEDVHGILQVALARLFVTASQAQSNGD
jgi:hypothetical protein